MLILITINHKLKNYKLIIFVFFNKHTHHKLIEFDAHIQLVD
jgi:hypothetical protein